MHTELLGCGLTIEGQLGVRLSEPNVPIPDRIIGAPNDADGTSVKQVACGENHTIFLTNDGKMWSVGGNADGQLGRGGKSEGSFSIYPVSTTSSVAIIQIAAGRAHSIAVAEDGRVFSWGSNEHGQLGLESSIQRQEIPKRITGLQEVVQISSGSDHCIALTDSGRVYVWGEQADGKCLHSPQIMEELTGVPIVRVIAGNRHCIAISASGAVFTWGQNDYGQLGFDDFKPQNKVHNVEQMNGFGVIEAACGDRHTVLLTHNGKVFSFGCDSLGQCGFGKKIAKRTNPTAVSDLIGSVVTKIATGRCHTIAIIGGFVYSFGLNSSGQLGNGSLRTQATPKKVDELDHVAQVFAGWDQTFFIRSTKIEKEKIGPNWPMKYPQKINKKILQKALESGEKLDVIGLIESVFSSLSSINNSFLFNDEKKYSVGKGLSHGVNLDEVMETFQLLDESSAKQQYNELIIEMLSMTFDCSPENFVSVECLRVFLILPWCSAFLENISMDIINKLHLPFSKLLCRINEVYGAIIETWWSKFSERNFRRILKVIKTAVREFVILKKDPIECQYFLHVLSKLDQINKANNIVPIDAFYIDELNESFDLKMDYYNWVMASHMGITTSKSWSCFPFLMNAIAKGDLLHVEAAILQQLRVQSAQVQTLLGSFYLEIPFLELHVRREFIVSDTMNQMANLQDSDLQKPLKIKIHGEEADDAGGVRKEFFLIVMQKILQPEYGMFVEDEDSHLVWFSGFAPPICERTQFRQLGRLVGLAIFNRVIVPFPFPLALYKYLLNQSPSLEDLCELSPIEGNGLQSLLDYEGDDVKDVFCLNFSITYDILGEKKTVELEKNGMEKSVTNENRHEYVQLYVKHRLESGLDNEIALQASSFRDGFRDAFHSRILSLFQPRELMELIVGNENYDWSQFREVVKYKGEYHSNHPTIIAFWKAFFQLDEGQRKKFLQFLSGSTRLPVAGMSALNVYIQPTDEKILPVAHTCFNLLDLPNIADSDELLRRLLISIEHTEGFTLV